MTALLNTAGDVDPAKTKRLLERAVTALRAGRADALEAFNDAHGPYRDGDLYVFCADPVTGTLTAHPTLAGTDIRKLKDKSGKSFGVEMLSAAREGEVAEVAYLWPRPDSTEPVTKISYVTRVDGQLCGVGFYS